MLRIAVPGEQPSARREHEAVVAPVTESVVPVMATGRGPGSCKSCAKPPVMALATYASQTICGAIMAFCAGVSAADAGPPKASRICHVRM